MTGIQNKEINGGELTSISPAESDKSLNLNGNIADRYEGNCKGFRAAVL